MASTVLFGTVAPAAAAESRSPSASGDHGRGGDDQGQARGSRASGRSHNDSQGGGSGHGGEGGDQTAQPNPPRQSGGGSAGSAGSSGSGGSAGSGNTYRPASAGNQAVGGPSYAGQSGTRGRAVRSSFPASAAPTAAPAPAARAAVSPSPAGPAAAVSTAAPAAAAVRPAHSTSPSPGPLGRAHGGDRATAGRPLPPAAPSPPSPAQVLGNRMTQPTDVAAAVQSAAATVGSIARRVPPEAAFPLGLLALLGAFLLVQHRIDRRDPKLALAPITQTLLEFGPPPGTATAG